MAKTNTNAYTTGPEPKTYGTPTFDDIEVKEVKPKLKSYFKKNHTLSEDGKQLILNAFDSAKYYIPKLHGLAKSSEEIIQV